jgi:hypothetical protein
MCTEKSRWTAVEKKAMVQEAEQPGKNNYSSAQ